MCKHPQAKIEVTDRTKNATPITKESDVGFDGFVNCDLNQSCPTSVTTSLGNIRLDQYQSSIREGTKAWRQKRLHDSATPSSKISHLPTSMHDTMFTDNEFEWYDLDAIRELDHGKIIHNTAITICHDFNAGLVFTTMRQVLNKEVEINFSNPANRSKDTNTGQEFEFDLFYWVNRDDRGNIETPADRAFRDRIQELEQEFGRDFYSSLLS